MVAFVYENSVLVQLPYDIVSGDLGKDFGNQDFDYLGSMTYGFVLQALDFWMVRTDTMSRPGQPLI